MAMSLRTRLPTIALAVLAAAVVAGLYLTRTPAPAEPGDRAADSPEVRRPRDRLVDMQPLLTARRMAALARTPEEQELARQALRLSDHVVDLALLESIRRIAEEAPEPTPEVKALAESKAKAQAAQEEAARRVEELTAQAAAAKGDERQRLEERRELARAQAELSQDELDGVEERLAQAGGDPQARIQRLRAAYDEGQKVPAPPPTLAPAGVASAGSLLARLGAYAEARARRAQLAEAREEAQDRAQRTAQRIERVTARLRDSEAEAGAASAPGAAAGSEEAAKRAALAAVRSATLDRRRLTALGKRQEDQKELAEVYADWIGLVDLEVRAALHQALRVVLVLLLLGALVLIGSGIVDRLFHASGEEQTKKGTLRMMAMLAVQVAGLVAALLVAFGLPGQATTILGLAGAGLTVALKDFIVAFFGWFVLMGRNGIRVGDWVEIEGVGGAVAEIGLFHTVLLETGSWADAGHPTGRRVSFVNSFAIEGHFFNFSTSGQWMWDDLRVTVPFGQDPYPVIDGLQRLVERETEQNTAQAEQEWRRTASRYRVRTFSAVPGINVVPTAAGVELQVRYITRAQERHETRRRLYQAVVELMHGPRSERSATP
ncbi:MAG TPA: mechanosensitive ion channel domain-containing protein [Anaeromyxobacter sp.]|nr:mechanosensitive ion channel domain-containing protein [Anaeromyxobacter sp.]